MSVSTPWGQRKLRLGSSVSLEKEECGGEERTGETGPTPPVPHPTTFKPSFQSSSTPWGKRRGGTRTTAPAELANHSHSITTSQSNSVTKAQLVRCEYATTQTVQTVRVLPDPQQPNVDPRSKPDLEYVPSSTPHAPASGSGTPWGARIRREWTRARPGSIETHQLPTSVDSVPPPSENGVIAPELILNSKQATHATPWGTIKLRKPRHNGQEPQTEREEPCRNRPTADCGSQTAAGSPATPSFGAAPAAVEGRLKQSSTSQSSTKVERIFQPNTSKAKVTHDQAYGLLTQASQCTTTATCGRSQVDGLVLDACPPIANDETQGRAPITNGTPPIRAALVDTVQPTPTAAGNVVTFDIEKGGTVFGSLLRSGTSQFLFMPSDGPTVPIVLTTRGVNLITAPSIPAIVEAPPPPPTPPSPPAPPDPLPLIAPHEGLTKEEKILILRRAPRNPDVPALMREIRRGTTLNKVVCNDRSNPRIR